MALPVLKYDSQGDIVKRWQEFLIGQAFLESEDILVDDAGNQIDNVFAEDTVEATKKFQASVGLPADGSVGSQTYVEAMKKGFAIVESDDSDFPPKPADLIPLDQNGRFETFGWFEWAAGSNGSIIIQGDWTQKNIVTVDIPQLNGVDMGGVACNGKIKFHRLAIAQLQGMWAAWEKAGLLNQVLTYGGSFVPRFIRGSTRNLSNHSFGSAFDVNVAWNLLGHEPAAKGQEGSVRNLVPIANDYGFYWGGHFSRRDGMHFEIARLLTQPELQELAFKYIVKK
jgi:hypothetical protein